MPEENTSAGTGVMPTPTTPEMGTPAASQGAMPEAGSGEDLKTEYEKLKHSLKNAQEELERHRKNAKKLSAYEEAEKAAKEAQLSEIELSKKQLAEIQAKYEAEVHKRQEISARHAVAQAARDLDFLLPDLAHKLIDGKMLEYDEDGNVTNAADVLKALIKVYPKLVPQKEEAQPAPQPATPAKQPQQPAPLLPPFSGRSSIPAPGGSTPGKIPSWNDIYPKQ